MKVRDVIRLLCEDGWFQVSQSGSHRQFKHPTKPGRATIAGKPGQEISPGTLRSIARQAGIKVGRP
jgi:predicted RNA binding protein YcfA (HicA-like mRNA interferase family)